MLSVRSLGHFARHRWVKAAVYVAVLVAMVLGLSLSPFVADTADASSSKGCWVASQFQKIWANNEWHWRAVVGVPTPTPPLSYWHVHGPAGISISLWPNSVTQGIVYVYFSYPAWLNPYAVFGTYQFVACLN